MLDLRTRKQGGPIKTWNVLINNLRALCDTCKINPEQLLVDKKTTETIIKNFAEIFKSGQNVRHGTSRKRKTHIHGIKIAVGAVRSFCAFHDMTWPRGTAGIMSAKVISHGDHSDIRLTDEELKKADRFIRKQWGIDSDIYRIFWVGIESCARRTALLDMNCDWTLYVNKETRKKIFIMTAFESKTAYIKKGKWTKYITRKGTQKSLQIHKSNGNSKIWTPAPYERKVKEMLSQLREIYRHLEKVDDYFYETPFHSLRHVGAHYWLSKTNYNFGFVAKIGGWHTIDELKTSYGEMPPDFVINMIDAKLV